MQKRSTANFGYRLGIHDHQNILLIWDKDLGNRSVTNDMENVVADIAQKTDIKPEEHLILYRDSEERWDGWDAITQDFFAVGTAVAQPIIDKLFPSPHERLNETLAEALGFIRQLTLDIHTLQHGYHQIGELLNRPGNVMKEEIRAVIMSTVDKFAANR